MPYHLHLGVYINFNMQQDVFKLNQIASKNTRLILGLMSGTSLDGLDIALCKISNAGEQTKVELINFKTIIYADEFVKAIKEVFSKEKVSLQSVSILNEIIGIKHAKYINSCLYDWRIKAQEVDLIASHGQTIYHAPKSFHKKEHLPNATLQIGDADHIAVETGIITISDFRQKHIAGGGEGAPLAIYADEILFKSKLEDRILLNIGGISNFTYLPKEDCKNYLTTDCGPGNGMMNAFCMQNNNGNYDKDGAFAALGSINENLLNALFSHEFFHRNFPKSTGPELFNLKFLEDALNVSNTIGATFYDIMATLNRFTAMCIAKSIEIAIGITNSLTVYVSGGGVHNNTLMNNLRDLMPNYKVNNFEDLGFNPDAKEAVLIALLANECIAGNPSYSRITPRISMGKISLPN